MEISIVREEDYIPECAKNRAEKKPVKVHIKYLSPSEDAGTYKANEGTIVRDRELFFALSVTAIENLAVKDETGHSQEITNGAELCSTPGLEEYYYDIILHINGKAGIDAKN